MSSIISNGLNLEGNISRMLNGNKVGYIFNANTADHVPQTYLLGRGNFYFSKSDRPMISLNHDWACRTFITI